MQYYLYSTFYHPLNFILKGMVERERERERQRERERERERERQTDRQTETEIHVIPALNLILHLFCSQTAPGSVS